MINVKYFYFPLLIVALLSITLFLMCSSEPTEPQNQVPMNITGSWELTSIITSNTCGIQSGESNTEVIDLTDNNGTLSIVNFDGLLGDGQFDGTTM